MRPMIDAHLDLALNAINYNRDLFLSVAELREVEKDFTDIKGRGRNTLTFPELKRCRVPVCVATVLARSGPDAVSRLGFKRADIDYATRQIAYSHCYGCLGHYAYGPATDGRLTPDGVQLLKEFMKVGMILDVTHLSDQSFWHAMDVYTGPVLASHHNLRALVPGDRQLADEQVKELIKRNA